MCKVARFIRKEIIDEDQWVFAGTFNDFENPPIFHTLLKWILLGTSNHVENETRRKGIDRSISVTCQHIIQSTKTSRQMNYKPQENVTRNREISYIVETPLNVNKLMTKLITTTVYLFQFIPIYSISKDLPVYFAIDNTDLKIDTTGGRNQLHGTRIALYQKKILQKFYNTYLLTAKVNQKIPTSQFIVSSIVQNQSARTAIMRICRNDNIVWTLMKTLLTILLRTFQLGQLIILS